MENNFFVVSGKAILVSHCALTGTCWTLDPAEGQVFSLTGAIDFVLSTPDDLDYKLIEVANYVS